MLRIGVQMPSTPDSNSAGLKQRRLQNICRTRADALVALDAAFEKILFLNGAGRTDDFLVVIAIGRARHAPKSEEAGANDAGEHRAAHGDRRLGNLALQLRHELE